eukprot:TRINITY_DN67609_c0_g1_i7.p1 TRINITY_DN67609_c0_g1~~TRINITY_DN67609_c0_g1_i7.p1  ORF type:complete len:232 (-),score=24.84 TRINITY_DN67609_c0_g1_i7:485-1180(-)
MKLKPLYPTHKHTNCLQKGLLTVGSALTALVNPQRADMVATLGDTTGHFALQSMRERMKSDATGRRILLERPDLIANPLNTATLLADYPAGTLGHQFGLYMQEHGFKSEERPVVRFVDDEELAYVLKRYREAHDFFHAITDLPPTVLGELGLKALEGFQTGLPMCWMSVSGAWVKLNPSEITHLFTKYLPWAQGCGGDFYEYYLNVFWEEELHTPVATLQKRLNVTPAPAV